MVHLSLYQWKMLVGSSSASSRSKPNPKPETHAFRGRGMRRGNVSSPESLSCRLSRVVGPMIRVWGKESVVRTNKAELEVRSVMWHHLDAAKPHHGNLPDRL